MPKSSRQGIHEVRNQAAVASLTKSQCNGARPLCSRCSRRSLNCIYETTGSKRTRAHENRDRNLATNRLIADLRSSLLSLRGASREDAAGAILAITSAPDPLAALAAFPNILPRPQGPPLQVINSAAVPSNVLPFQYELMVHHPQAYPVVTPLVHNVGDPSILEPSYRKLM
jgi:hypothetical protein